MNLAIKSGTVGAVAVFVMVVAADALVVRLENTPFSLGRALLIGALAAILSGFVLAWWGRGRARRLTRLLAFTDTWLRGNLSLRVNDPGNDELSDLAAQLDVLVENLEEDEQDLDRLRESNTRLTDQVRALALVEERNRLARELHDSVKQQLFSLAMTASAVRTRFELMDRDAAPAPSDEPEIGVMIREIEASARAAQRETTRLIEDLRPAPLQERGLAAALNDYTLLFGAQQHLLVYLDVKCDDRLLPPIVTEHLYRVAQETLHNVARHANATRVDIRLRCSGRRVTLTLEDNGAGFDTHLTRKGLGISGMQERLMAIGGRLTVESSPGSGTTVLAEAEIPAAAEIRPAVPRPADDTVYVQAKPAEGAESECPQAPRPEAWSWLGERLVIPVGQTWPWLPADQEHYLRRPVIEPGKLILKRGRALLGLRRAYSLQIEGQSSPLARITRDRTGYSLDFVRGAWNLRRVRGLKGRAVLERNEQALAAMQFRGRQMDTWTEVVYDDRSYRLHYKDDKPGGFLLCNGADEPVLDAQEMEITLLSTLPLPLITMVVARIVDESTVRQAVQER